MRDRFALANALRELGSLLELSGENPFKVRAYERGARAIEELGEQFGPLAEADKLTQVEGIGEAIAQKARDFLATGTIPALEKVRAELPPGLIALAKLPGLGPKRARQLQAELDLHSLEDLRKACEHGQVRGLKGFGEKMEQKLLASLEGLGQRRTQILLVDARREGEPLAAYLANAATISRVELAGSLRRWKEQVSDLDVLVATDDPAAAMAHFTAYPEVVHVEGSGETKTTAVLKSGLQVDLRALPPEDFATALHHFTGSKAHHTRLRGLARARGLTLSEWGVFELPPGGADPQAEADAEAEDAAPPISRRAGGKKRRIESEAALYAAVGLPYIPPELREDQGEFEAAARGETFDDLITVADLRGIVHCHSTHSDGRATLLEMAQTAEALGMAYLTVTDHSPTANYAHGVTLDRLKAQWDEINDVQQRVKIRLLRGTESDILEDGALDYPDAILELFEVVIASVHNRYGLDSDEMTARLKTCMQLPMFKIWGHPLGRMLMEREPIDCRVEEVLDALAASRGAIEVNGNPQRLDLAPQWIRRARERGLKFTCSVDAHSPEQLGENLPYAVATARRGGVRKAEVLNALPLEAFARAVKPVG